MSASEAVKRPNVEADLESEELTLTKKRRIKDSGYSEPSILGNVVLIVEGQSLYVNKETLMLNSPVFYQMFTGPFKEAQTDPLKGVPLPDKDLLSVIWMVDFLYHKIPTLTDEMAAALLPLANEYQIDSLKTACIDELMKQTDPKLSHIRLAEMFDLSDLYDRAVEMCGSVLSPEEIERQLSLEINQGFPESILLKIYRRKITEANKFLTEIRKTVSDMKSDGSDDNGCDSICSGRGTRQSWEVDLKRLIGALEKNQKAFGPSQSYWRTSEFKFIQPKDD